MATTALAPATRAPRFRRPETPTHLQLTERDFAIMRAIARLRFARSTHVAELIGGSEKKIIERTGQLFYAGYLDRPAAQLDYYRAGGGSSPIINAIANRGARVLIEQDGLEAADLDWARKNRDATRRFIKHTLAVADISVALIVAVRNRPELTLENPATLIARMPETTQKTLKPFKLRVNVQHKGGRAEIGVVPDHAAGVVYPDASRRCFLIESDMGTMPVERESLKQTSIVKKCLAYETARKQALHERHYGWKNFRVLIVTNTAERAANIRAAIMRTATLKGSPLFLVTDKPALDAAPDILEHAWHDATGKTHTLI